MGPSSTAALSRRRLLAGSFAAGCTLRGRIAWAQSDTGQRIAAIEQASRALCAGRLHAPDWRAQTEAALAGVSAASLHAAVGCDWDQLEELRQAQGYVSRPLSAAELQGWSEGNAARPKLFALAPGRAILPHAHRHIVSVFIVLEGRVFARHYDRVRDEADAVVIRPSSAGELGAGAVAAISETRDNVHWFTALEPATLFNFSVSLPPLARTQPGAPGRVYLDPGGAPEREGVIRAPRTSLAQLRARYE